VDPLAMHRWNKRGFIENDEYYEDYYDSDEDEQRDFAGCTPAHILCMQQQPNTSLVTHLCLLNPKAFAICDQSGRCALHLVAQYSESIELLQNILQMDCKMTKSFVDVKRNGMQITPLGLLCRRLYFATIDKSATFDKMISCLLEADSSVEVIYDGIIECLRYSGC
jgi:hypothetical protein